MNLITEQNRKWWILVSMGIVLFMVNLDFSIANLALPAIAHALGANLVQLQWVISGYMLTMVIFMVLGGRLGDLYGHRKIFLIGIIIFTLSSVMAGFAFTERLLIIARIVQGIGAALVFPLTSVITFAVFPKNQKGLALGTMATTIGLAQAVGPTLGGVIIKYLSWNWVFFINLPIGILAVIATLLACPRYILALQQGKIDYLGATLLTISLMLLIVAVNQAQVWGVDSIPFFSCFISGLILLGVFIKVELTIKHPLIQLQVFLNKKFTTMNLVRANLAYVFGSILFVLVLYLQNMLGYSALAAGMLLLFMTITFGALSPVLGKMLDHLGAYYPVLISLILMSIVLAIFTQVTMLTPFYELAMLLFVCGIVFAIIFTATNVVALKAVPESQIGAASGAFYTVALGGCMLGVAVSGTIMGLVSRAFLSHQLLLQHISLSSDKDNMLISIANGSHSLSKVSANFTAETAQLLKPMAQQAFLHAFHWAMLICMLLSIGSLIMMLFIKLRRAAD
ncbi:MAG: MFS transporter [Gammaproteobacteria bacterium]|nr:MFS transporter [Gammaproteobacteria bacterium]